MFTFIIALLGAPAIADDPLLDGFTAEVERANELKLPGHGPPHHLLVRGTDGWTARANARFGALVYSELEPRDGLHVELRAGTPQFDSAGLGSRWDQPGFETRGVPDVPTVRAVREGVWRIVDTEYKSAIENLGRKQGAKEELDPDGDRPADWQEISDPVVKVERSPVEPPDLGMLEGLVRRLSAPYKGRRLDNVQVHADITVGHRVMVSTDGTRVVHRSDRVRVWVNVTARADNNEVNPFRWHWAGNRWDEVPSEKELTKAIDALVQRAETWRDAPRLEEPWYGPVLLEGEGAASLIERVVVGSVKGTPPEARWESWSQKVEAGGQNGEQPGTRLLPRGWTVRNDDAAELGEPCCPRVDSEGMTPVAVDLVQDGLVVGHLMSRTPNKYFDKSTGNARSRRDGRCEAQATSIQVTAPRTLSRARLWKAAAKMARQQGLDRVLVISDFDRSLAVWRALDGTETPVRGLMIAELDSRAARSMTIAGPSSTSQSYHWFTQYTVPDLLLSNVAVKPDTPSPEAATKRQSPLLATKATKATK